MRNTIITALFLLFTLNAFAQKVIESPSFGATNVANLKIQKIVRSDTATVLHFKAEPGRRFRIAPKSYLLENGNEEKLMLKWARGIKLDEFVTINADKTEFVLGFRPISPTSTAIDFIEDDCEGCFKIVDISLQPVKRVQANQALKGNWYKTDGSKEWVLGLYDSIAVYKSRAWKYTSSGKSKKIVLNLVSGGETKVLYAETDGKGQICYIGEDKNDRMRLSRDNSGPLAEQFDRLYEHTVFKSDSAVYQGVLGAYSRKLGYKTGSVSVNNNFTGEQESYLITISEDGSFYVKFPMHCPQTVYVRFPGLPLTVYCEPGKETFQYVNLAESRQAEQFMGETSLMNRELTAANSLFVIDFEKRLTEIHEFTPTQYKQYVLADAEKRLNALETYRLKNSLSKKAHSYLEREIKFRAASELFEYNRMIEYAYRRANKIPFDRQEQSVNPVKLDSAYLDYVRTLPLNDETAFITSAYNAFINRICFANIVRDNNIGFTFAHIVEGLKKDGVIFSEEDEQSIQEIITSERVPVKNSGEERKRNEEVIELYNSFNSKYRSAISAFVYSVNNEVALARLKKVFGVETSLLTDVIYSQETASKMNKSFTPLSAADKQIIQARITTPAVTSALAKLDEEISSKIEANKKKGFVGKEVPRNEGEKVFETIVQQYKGKAIYIDFWATWCGPCLSGIREIAPLKEELKDEDVVFLYITDHTSPLETYKNVIADIRGEHYRLSPDEWNYISAKFKISGIPHYVLVDKKGEVVDPNMPHSSNSAIKEKLMGLK